MMPVMMMTVVIIYHNSLQEQITQDNLSLFYFEPNQQILQTTPTIMLHYKFHRFFAISTGRPGRWQSPFHPPRNTNRVFKAFSISRNSPSDVNKRNSILDKHRLFRFDFIIIIIINITTTINIIKEAVNLFYVVIRANAPLDLLL